MYEEYFGLTEKPFQITPDPRFLYLSQRHRDGFAHLLYGADQAGGFVLLTGEVGTGKTTLCRSALAQATENVRVALILNPKQSPIELVASICDELQVSYPQKTTSIKALIDKLNLYLLRAYGQGQRIVVVIDEAQNLAVEVLEQVRLLTNLEVSTQKLLQIILIGQPELSQMLERPELRQLAQRITARFHLTPLNKEETEEYISHRLKIAGVNREIFTKSATQRIFHYSGGIPRLINTLCERSLIGAYGFDVPVIKKDIVNNAAKEVLGQTDKAWVVPRWMGAVAAALMIVIAGLFAWQIYSNNDDQTGIVLANVPEVIPDEPSKNDEISPKENTVSNASPVESTASETNAKTSNKASMIFSEQHILAGTTAAFTKLFDLWKKDYAAYTGKTACTKANNAGMRCIFGQGSLDMMTQYNRPAVLELKSKRGEIVFAVISELSAEEAKISITDNEITLSTQELENYWTGNYIVFWQPPFPDNESIAQGYKGPDVLWLRHQLDEIEGLDKAEYSADNLKFDEHLSKRVSVFQAQQGLTADGIVGRETFIALANKAGTGAAPRLMLVDEG
jgi:general secretion pathway protein A